MFRKGGVTMSDDGWRYTIVHCCTNLELDHRLPLSEGGNNELSNLWLLCVDCHKKKTSIERSGRLKALFSEWREQQVAS